MTLFNDTITIKRTTGKTIDNITGIVSSGSTATISDVVCNVQPAGKDEISILPEGLRDRETVLVMTETELLLQDQIVLNTNVEYRVHIIENFTGFNGSIGKWEAICVKEKGQGLND